MLLAVNGRRKGREETMDTNVLEEIEKLRRASLAELQARYREVFGDDEAHRELLNPTAAFLGHAVAGR